MARGHALEFYRLTVHGKTVWHARRHCGDTAGPVDCVCFGIRAFAELQSYSVRGRSRRPFFQAVRAPASTREIPACVCGGKWDPDAHQVIMDTRGGESAVAY